MNQVINAIKLSSCISAQDGVISNRELDKCFELVTEHFEGITKEIFDPNLMISLDYLTKILENMDYILIKEKKKGSTINRMFR